MTTPYPAVTSFTDGSLVQQYQVNGYGSHLNNLYTRTLGGFRTTLPICTVRLTSTTFTVPNATDTTVSWDVADLNTDNMWSSSNPTVLTVNTTGIWFLYIQLGTNGTASGLASRVLVNGVTSLLNTNTTCSIQGTYGNSAGIAHLTAGAVITGVCYQTNGSPATLQTTSGGCRMAAFLLAGGN